MANEPYKSVSTFALPDAYQQQAAEARRRRRMAEMLAQQAYQPGDIQNAPIPAAAPLVQGLQAYLAARAGRKADEAEESARETASREARQLFRALTEEGDTTTNAVQPAMTPMAKTVTAPQFEDGRITAPASIEMGAPPPMTAPETQLSRYNLTPGQRRAAALEGMLTSENPMLQKVAGAIYPTLQPEKAKLQTAAVNLKDLTPASARLFAASGDPQDIEYAVEPGKAPTVSGGMMWDAEKGFVAIPGYEEQQRRIAAAKRPDVVVRDTANKGPSEASIWRAEDKLRGDFETITAPLRGELSAINKINDIMVAARNDPSTIDAISQQSIVILLNKFLDPTSVVREGEFDRVIKAQGLEARARNFIDRIAQGKPLDVSAINQIADLAKLYERAADSKIRQYANEYSTIAENRKLDVGSVITNPNYRPRKINDEDVEVQ